MEPISAITDATTLASSDAPALPLTGIAVGIVPALVNLPISTDRPETAGGKQRPAPGTRLLHSPYHVVEPGRGALVSLTWTRAAGPVEERSPRLIRLSVRGESADWNPRWVRWMYVSRRPQELRGGAAATAQDNLSEDGTVLTLLLLPEDERREVTLELDVVATKGIAQRAGDYPFVILAEEREALPAEGESTGSGKLSRDTVSAVLRRFHPPSPTLEYLPAIYQEAMVLLSEQDAPIVDALKAFHIGGGDASASSRGSSLRRGSVWEAYREPPFFARYLRGYDDILEPIQEALARLYLLFDADTTPREFVPWLAQWVALVLDENWPELKRRRLIREAVELYRWRGTRKGLSRYLEIYAGVTPQIYDQPMVGMRIGSGTRLGAPETRMGNVPQHTFVVALSHPNPSELNEGTIRAIIEAQKPAHTRYTLTILSMQSV